ncbi:hypothetical protein [Arthrobacter sp. NPDC058192]|uniref:hypothetical protein n=1 Tax=Arthrobacter sp. NPDC058192 TaxID=3346372 RepID=UPI0036EF9A32
MATERSYVSYATAAVALAAIPLSFAGPEGLRLAVVGLLMLAGPGTALVRLLHFSRPHSAQATGALPLSIAIAVAFSLAMSTLVATAMIYARLWSPPVSVCILSVITLAFLALDLKKPKHVLVRAK